MRITDNLRVLAQLRTQAATSERVSNASRRASAGARVVRPSDDPVAYATVVRRDGALSTMTSRARTARQASDELAIAERALDASTSVLDEVRSIAVNGANGTLSAADRANLALRVDALREQLLELANTRGANGYAFGGTRTNAPPFDAAGNFLGNDGVTVVPVADGVAPRGNVSGARAFTALGGRDVFADVAGLAAALRAGDVVQIRASLDDVGKCYEQVVEIQVEAGLSMDQLQATADVVDQAAVSVASSRARATGADDPAALYTELQSASSAFERSLEVTRRLLALPSLAR